MINIWINWSAWGELGDSLGAFTDGVFGEFSGKEELYGSLDFSEWESPLFIVSDELAGFNSDSIEDVVNERVHDAHGFLGDSSLGVDLFQHLVNVNAEGFNSLLVSLLSHNFFYCFSNGFLLGWHFYYIHTLSFFFKYYYHFLIPHKRFLLAYYKFSE